MADNSYWSGVLNSRVSRRRALAATGASAAAAAFLAACGGGSNETQEVSSLVAKSEDTTKQGVSGGVMHDLLPQELTNLDPLQNASTATLGRLVYGYSTLAKAGINTTHKQPGLEDITGDASEKWEISPDLMQITWKLRQNHKFDPRPPTNSRVMTSDDVKWSWDKYVAIGPSAGDVANSRSEVGPVTSVTTPDPQTVVMKLAFPLALILRVFSDSKNFYVEPRLDNFDFKTEMRGSGPFFLEKYATSDGMYWNKNPDWYEKGQPFLDRLEMHLILDYAAGLTQFEAGNLWAYTVRPRDVLAVKARHPEMTLLEDRLLGGSGHTFMFSHRPDADFQDARVRRALSMSIDRDLLLNVFLELEENRKAGLPADPRWHSHLSAFHSEWEDPKGTGLGEGAKYFKHDLAEARKLLEAAGVKIPYQSSFVYYTDRNNDDPRNNEIYLTTWNDSKLFDLKADIRSYASGWRDAESSRGQGFQGLLFSVSSSLNADSQLVQLYTPTGRNSVLQEGKPLPGIQELILKQRQEPDTNKRNAIVKEIQQKMAVEMPSFLYPGAAPMFTVRWPWLKNHGVWYEGDPTSKMFTRWWYDAKEKKA